MIQEEFSVKKSKITKVIASTLVLASVFLLKPVGANAEWKQDSTGWWNTEGDSYSVGWKKIDGKWYDFGQDGYMKTGWLKDSNEKWYYLNSDGSMAHDTTIGGYTLGSDGSWIAATPAVTTASSVAIVSDDKDIIAPQLVNQHLTGHNSTKDKSKFTASWIKATDNKSSQNKLRYYLYKSENVGYGNDIAAWEKNATLINQGGSMDISSIDLTLNSTVVNYFKLIVVDEANNKTAYEGLRRNIF